MVHTNVGSIVGHSTISSGVGRALHVGRLGKRAVKSAGSSPDDGRPQVVTGVRVVDDEFVSLLSDGALRSKVGAVARAASGGDQKKSPDPNCSKNSSRHESLVYRATESLRTLMNLTLACNSNARWDVVLDERVLSGPEPQAVASLPGYLPGLFA